MHVVTSLMVSDLLGFDESAPLVSKTLTTLDDQVCKVVKKVEI